MLNIERKDVLVTPNDKLFVDDVVRIGYQVKHYVTGRISHIHAGHITLDTSTNMNSRESNIRFTDIVPIEKIK